LPITVRFYTLAKLIIGEKEYTALMTEPWTSVDDIARHLGVAKDSIYRWIERRSLPAHRIGRLWKFKISEVDAWVRAGGADSHRCNDGNKR
jgi:excisionase family DNA binding protein